MSSAGTPPDEPGRGDRRLVPVIVSCVVAALVVPALLLMRYDDTSAPRLDSVEAVEPRLSADGDGDAIVTPTTAPGDAASTLCCGEGRVGLFVVADREFDPWTREPSPDDQAFMRTNFDSMMVFSPYFDRRLEWYPEATIYLDAAAIYVGRPTDDRFEEHPDWVLRDAAGDPLYIDFGCDVASGCPQYIADVGNEAFRTDFVERLEALVDLGYTSVLLDDVNLSWRISDRNGDERRPIDPRTGDEMTLRAWQRAFTGLVERVRDEFPDMRIVHNSLWFTDSPDFDNGLVDRQIRAADVVFLERGATDRGLVNGDSTFGFRTFLAFIDRVHALERSVVLFDKSDGSIDDQVFNLATGLVVNGGDDEVGTARDEFVAPSSYWTGFDIDLGDATTDRYDWNGLIRRDFTGGIVLLGEPGADPVTVQLNGDYVDMDGAVVDVIEIAGGRAAILRPS